MKVTAKVVPLAAELCDVPCFKTDVVSKLRATMPDDEVLEEVRTRFAALADKTRLKVLFALGERDADEVEEVGHGGLRGGSPV